jgi:hypothetical protein
VVWWAESSPQPPKADADPATNMTPLYRACASLLEVLPLIILTTMIEVVICFSAAYVAMMLLAPKLGPEHSYMVLGVGLMTAVGTQAWLLFNHKIRAYLKAKGA